MVLYTIKDLLLIRDILKTLHPRVLSITLKFSKDNVLEKQQLMNSAKGSKIK